MCKGNTISPPLFDPAVEAAGGREAPSGFWGQDERDLHRSRNAHLLWDWNHRSFSDKKSGASSPSAWQAGRWAGGRVLVVSALRFSRSAQLTAPWAAPDSCSATAQLTAGPQQGHLHEAQEHHADAAEEDAYEAQVTGVSFVFRGAPGPASLPCP